MTGLPDEARAAIRERRLALGLTQAEAAAAAGVAGTTFNTVEVGQSAGSGLVRAGICRALGWTADSIDRLERGESPVEAAATPTGDGDMGAAFAELAAAVERLADEVARQRSVIDRLVVAELARKEEDRRK